MKGAKKSPPAVQGRGTLDAIAPTLISQSLTPNHDALLAGVHVAVVQIKGSGQSGAPIRYRRRVMFNLPSAQRAIDRATMDGLDASIVLCQLTPVNGVLND